MEPTYTPGERIQRTVVQGGASAALVLVLAWIARISGIDLDPGDGENMPGEVGAALSLLFTSAAAWWMNRQPKTPVNPLEP